MKTFLLFCIVVATATAENVRLSEKQRQKIFQHGIECVNETGASVTAVIDAKNGNYTGSEDLKEFMFCVAKKAGIVNTKGELNIDVALERLPPGADKAEAEKVLNRCSTKTGRTARDIAYKILKCYQKGTNQRLVVD